MLDLDFESNETLNANLRLGSEKLFSYKKAIRRLVYSDNLDLSCLESAKDIIDGYKKNGGSSFDVMELQVFFLECVTYFLDDVNWDFEEDFYEVLGDAIEEILKQLKNADQELFDCYAPRFIAMIEGSENAGFSYQEQLTDCWEQSFGKL